MKTTALASYANSFKVGDKVRIESGDREDVGFEFYVIGIGVVGETPVVYGYRKAIRESACRLIGELRWVR